ncbi:MULTISPECIES: HEAT repeat domain-containing protein [Treponema]|mgnify:CR=1 FL=1|uniref:HEAT repeats n=1 Tax=Treponema porcinum TaxID=261392 RepID=A0A1T4M3A1_TREPO|nr:MULTISPECIES: HEAT repeat domain-containing protein [Treponema]MCI5645344.1 HEAT repeat domain-containing protein [Treponema porcinum]MCI6481549.1 HEAT repeat domain-containing protein [Treponema porcinum]MDD7126507.1 HEAT repeat domain-containing protein [Treponema porcinum]MDY4467878.1 HEAT repeat domain-containing protein [Treponema porcinum]MDY5120912.1 HEAT repeat domain-containing protein [Treponema porcinum]
MKMTKKIVCAFSCIMLSAALFAQEQAVQKQQTSSAKSESSVEDEYLSDVDGIVILGLAASDEYENKLYAMQMLEAAVDGGNTNPDVMKALNQLAGEGINTQSRTNGRLINNFPDIRRRACLALGKVKTEESKNYLMQITLAENEPMVIAAAVNSLGEIGINNNDEVVNAIAFANRRNQILNPTSSLAAEVIDCYAKLAESTENKKSLIDSLTQIAADYHYNKTVRNNALKLLKTISSSSSSSSSEAK